MNIPKIITLLKEMGDHLENASRDISEAQELVNKMIVDVDTLTMRVNELEKKCAK